MRLKPRPPTRSSLEPYLGEWKPSLRDLDGDPICRVGLNISTETRLGGEKKPGDNSLRGGSGLPNIGDPDLEANLGGEPGMSIEPNIRGDVGLLPGDPNRSLEIRLANPIKPADFDLLLLMSLLGLKDLLAPLS